MYGLVRKVACRTLGDSRRVDLKDENQVFDALTPVYVTHVRGKAPEISTALTDEMYSTCTICNTYFNGTAEKH